MVTEWVPNGNVVEYLRTHHNADRICLVSPLACPPQGGHRLILQITADRCGPGTRLPPLARDDTLRPKVCQSYLHDSAACNAVLMNLVKETVLVNSASRACISDIGFAAFAHNEEPDTDATRCSICSSRWTAPEVSKNGEFSKQSDVFSFGFVAVEVRF